MNSSTSSGRPRPRRVARQRLARAARPTSTRKVAFAPAPAGGFDHQREADLARRAPRPPRRPRRARGARRAARPSRSTVFMRALSRKLRAAAADMPGMPSASRTCAERHLQLLEHAEQAVAACPAACRAARTPCAELLGVEAAPDLPVRRRRAARISGDSRSMRLLRDEAEAHAGQRRHRAREAVGDRRREREDELDVEHAVSRLARILCAANAPRYAVRSHDSDAPAEPTRRDAVDRRPRRRPGQPALAAHQDRAKPAVPVGGKFRLIDVPISNSLHAGIDRIYVITQFNSESLHRHIAQTYRFDVFSGGYVHILAAEQTVDQPRLVPGHGRRRAAEPRPPQRAEAGRHPHPLGRPALPDEHRRPSSSTTASSRADLTVAVKPVPREEASAFGIMRVDTAGAHRRVRREAQAARAARPLHASRPRQLASLGFEAPAGSLLASMGIYVFRREVLNRAAARRRRHRLRPPGDPAGDRPRPRSSPTTTPATGSDIGTIPTFHRPTSTSRSRCRRSTSTAPTGRSTPTRASCPAPRSTTARCSSRSSARARSSPAARSALDRRHPRRRCSRAR